MIFVPEAHPSGIFDFLPDPYLPGVICLPDKP